MTPTDGPPRQPRPRRRRWRWRLLALLIGVVAAVLLLEVGLRLLNIAPPLPYDWVGRYENRRSRNFEADPDLGWRMRPSRTFTADMEGKSVAYRSDAGGFRCSANGPAPRRGHLIALVGDSNTWGFGLPYEQSFGAILGRELPDVTVRNFAQPGFGIDQAYQALRHCALAVRPDVVVFGIVRDDFQRSLHAYRHTEGFNKPTFAREAGTLRRLTAADRPGLPYAWLDDHSNVWMAGKRLMERIGYRFGIGEWWQLNAALFDAARAACERAGVELVFVRLPEPGEEEFPALDAYMARVGAEYVDPMRTRSPTRVWFHDRHLDARGHRWVADALLRVLRSRFR